MRARIGVVAIAAGLLPAGPLAAQEGGMWTRFPGSAYASQGDPTDRSFVRVWEATPPKGIRR